ncbi:putative receptor protein kinase ZmPK1 [Hordeum vulgare]|nr:putative receptor protein kinase ZmPK1 [Hordeum vulgare]
MQAQALLAGLALLCLAAQQTGLLPAAMARTNLTAGDALAPPRYITSPSGGFAFGFRALDSDPTKFVLATWFRLGDGDGQPQPQPQSVVWFAKKTTMGSAPVATAESVLSVTADGHLTLTDGGGGGQELWRAPTPSMQRGSVLALADSGNVRFLATGGDGDTDTVLWESFRYPTDTLLPGQPLAPSLGGSLFSKRADGEFATGRFSLAAQPDGNIVLCIDLFTGHIQHNSYWATNTYGSGDNTTVVLDDRGFLNYTLHDGTVHTLISPAEVGGPNGGNYLRFARMDTDGIVRTYTSPRDGGEDASWTVSGALPGDGGCTKATTLRQGLCGPGSYCMETKDRLSCLCPSGYTYVDAQHTDSGCTPEFETHSSCSASSDEFSLVEMPNTTWEISLYYKKYPSVTVEQCRSYCLSHCYCAAALMINGSDCAEVGALTYGRRADDVATTALIKVRKGNNTNTPPADGKRKRKILGPYGIATLCVSGLLLVTIGSLVAQRYLVGDGDGDGDSQRPLSSGVRAFSWKELHQATNGFEKLLGKGSFGEVYKGTIGSHPIAVKKLIDSNEYSEQEFTNEVQSIGQIHHRNLVRMIGYCKEGKHRMLVFEFMPGGSLRGALFATQPQERRPPWRWRAEAAVAIARGLEYLHDGCAAPVIHCDIKPDNILLDGRGVPRITDFGISKLLGSQQVHTTVTHIRGTRGYIAPEWLRSDARVDTKADVYSFGVVLLEMICCRRCQERVVHGDDLPPGMVEVDDHDDDDETVTLFGWAAQLVVARRTELMLDGDAGVDTAEDMERVEQFARVALWCIEPNPHLRPSMHQVLQMLETRSGAQGQPLPDPPSCYIESSPLIPQLKIQH